MQHKASMPHRAETFAYTLALRWIVFCIALHGVAAACWAGEPFRIQVVDDQNGWPVPLVELSTTHHQRFVSDNEGFIAIDSPELMNRDVWFHVIGHGYSVPQDGFGYRGVRLHPRPGASHELKVHRELPGKRLGRLTGGGIFAESQKLGLHSDWPESGVFGCDSVQSVTYRGRRFWAWGDTTLASYPLGRFHATGATTDVQPLLQLQPPIALRFEYYTDENSVPRNIAKMPGRGPTWLTGMAVIPDYQGRERLVATYTKIEPPLREYELGLCIWDDATESFTHYRTIWSEKSSPSDRPEVPRGHSSFWTDADGVRWLLFGDPFPTLKCRASLDAWSDPGSWQSLVPQSTVPTRAGNKSIRPHRGSIAPDARRNVWVAIFTELDGESSYIGDLWYAEAASPSGPWEHAVQVVRHDKYSFYNPMIHEPLARGDDGILLFEATYTHTFSKTSQPTPRHDYNQILYRIDLEDLGGQAEESDR